MIGKMASAFGLLMIFGVVSYGQSTWVLPDYSTSTLSLGIQQMGESMMLSNSIFNSQMALSSMSSGRKVNSGRRLSDKVKRGAGRGATRGSGAVRRGTTRFVSTAAPLMPARLAAELGRTPKGASPLGPARCSRHVCLPLNASRVGLTPGITRAPAQLTREAC